MLFERSHTKYRSFLANRHTSKSLRSVVPSVPQKLCAACHSTCLKCSGSHDYECTECALDAVFKEAASNKTYCVPQNQKIPLEGITAYDGDDNINGTNDFSHNKFIHETFTLFFIYLLVIILIAVTTTYLIIKFIVSQFCAFTNSKDQNSYAYDRIAYDGTNDHIIVEQELLNNFSDSEEIDTNK